MADGRCVTSPVSPLIELHEHPIKLSARNVLSGKVVEIKNGATTAHVRLDVGGTINTASITIEAVDELKLVFGQLAHAVVKACDVMIAVD